MIAGTPALLTPFFWPHVSSTLLAFATAFAIYVSVLAASIVFYRLSPFHPLAKYPGPLINRVSKLYMSWISSKGHQHEYYHSLHEQYGDVVRIGKFMFTARNSALKQ